MAELEYKTLKATLAQKAEGEPLHITGYGCAFGNVDSWGDVIEPTACDRYLASEDMARTRLCWQHDIGEIIGTITEMHADEKGLRFEADLIDTARGKDAQECIAKGALAEFSIGYWVNSSHDEELEGKSIRFLDDITIAEISLVSRAANPKAVLTAVKSEDAPEAPAEPVAEAPAADVEAPAPEEEKAAPAPSIPNNDISFTENKSSEKMEDINKNIEALDASVKAQQSELDALRKEVKENTAPTEFKKWVSNQFEAHRAELETAWKNGTKKGEPIQFKTDPAAIGSSVVSPGNWYGVNADGNVYGAPAPALAFLAAFGQRNCVGTKLGWIEAAGNAANSVGYVEELAQNSNLVDFAFTEKTRKYGKIAAKLSMSTEFSDWYQALYDWCTNEGARLIENKFDYEVFNGDGADVAHPTHAYGLKTAATAFSALGKTQFANAADVIGDARLQISKAGFNANVAIVTWPIYSAIRELKDGNGRYLYNEALGTLNGIRILPSSALAEGEMLIADSNCAQVYGGGNSYELEIVRNADYDRNDIYFRKRVQVKVPASHAKGLVYVADVEAAIAALLDGSANGGDL